ncbi:MAG: hypothetical protein GWN07_37545, partial [Actinobacteria bacterium]|nr:hypothetical protein [Actinomycetota bacterium]NIW33051.1 hypothetical protein [Actinomycetota bacterium]NIX25201.1 hypothetical protein [Actinomycetota bacterium]
YYAVTHVGPENDESVPTAELAARITPPGGADTTPPDIDVVSPTQQQWGAAPRVVVHL